MYWSATSANINFKLLTPSTQATYMDFRAPQARKFWEFTPPAQGIYIVFSAAGEKILEICTAYTRDLH